MIEHDTMEALGGNVGEWWGVVVVVWSLSHVGLLRLHGLSPARLLSSWGFSRKEYWSGLPFPSLGDLPDPGMEPGSPALLADPLPSELLGEPWFGSGISHRSWGISQSSKQAIFLSGLTNEK